MHNRIASALGGVGLFAAVLGFVAAAVVPAGESGGPWGYVMAFGLIAFLWSVFDRTVRWPDRS
jgi:hypothetical protein